MKHNPTNMALLLGRAEESGGVCIPLGRGGRIYGFKDIALAGGLRAKARNWPFVNL
jgi:hypothetical protein